MDCKYVFGCTPDAARADAERAFGEAPYAGGVGGGYCSLNAAAMQAIALCVRSSLWGLELVADGLILTAGGPEESVDAGAHNGATWGGGGGQERLLSVRASRHRLPATGNLSLEYQATVYDRRAVCPHL